MALCLVCIAIGSLSAGLAWSEPLELVDYQNIAFYGISAEHPQGLTAVAYYNHPDGAQTSIVQLYYPDGQPYWSEAKRFGVNYLDITLCFSSEGDLYVVERVSTLDEYQELRVSKFNLNGSPAWDSASVTALRTPGSDLRFSQYLMVPDLQGGLRILSRVSGSVYQPYYQCISSSGQLSMPITDQNFIPDLCDGSLNLEPLPDGGAIISYSNDYYMVFRRLDSAGNTVWMHTEHVQGYSWGGNFKLDGDSGVYISTYTQHELWLKRLDPEGNLLWADSLMVFSGMDYLWNKSMSVDAAGNLAMFVICNDHLSAQSISREGQILWPDSIDLGSMEYSDLVKTKQDGAGGYFTVIKKSLNYITGITANHIDAAGQSWQQPKTVLPTYTETRTSGVHVAISGNSLKLLYYAGDNELGGLYSQYLSIDGDLRYPGNGLPFLAAAQGLITGIQIHPLGSTRALLLMTEQSSVSANMFLLRYNYLYSDGSLEYGKHRLLGTSLTSIATLVTEETPEGGFEVYWTSGPSICGQKLSPEGDLLWQEGGMILGTGYPYCRLSFWEGSLYATRAGSYQIYLQKFTDGVRQWVEDKHVANMDYLSQETSAYEEYQIYENYLVWSCEQNEWTDQMVYFTRFDAQGNALLGTDLRGLPLITSLPTHQGVSFKRAIVVDSGLYLEYKYCSEVWVPDGGHSGGGMYVPYYSYGAYLISPSGQINVAWGNLTDTYMVQTVLSNENLYQQTQRTDQHILEIWKRSPGGVFYWSSYNISDLPWQASAFTESPDGDLVLLSGLLNGTNKDYHYFLIDSSGQLQTPLDSFIFSSPSEYALSVFQAFSGNILCMRGADSKSMLLLYLFPESQVVSPPLLPGADFEISHNSPNPFKTDTSLKISLKRDSGVRLDIYNFRGQLVRSVDYPLLSKGRSELGWDGRDAQGVPCSRGVYILKINAGGTERVLKVLKF